VEPPAISQKTRPKVIATIPCFDTGSVIADVVLRTSKYVDRVVVIDDGSRDGTAAAARGAGALVVSHGSNRGYGEAIKSCFEVGRQERADVLVILDGDNQHNPDDIQHLLEPILRGEADLTIGSRFLGHDLKIPAYRRFGIGVITGLWNFGSRIKVSDTQSGFRAYSRQFFLDLPLSAKGMSVSIEILENARSMGVVIKEVPISCFYQSSAPSLRAFKQGLGVAFSVIRYRLSGRQGQPTKGIES